MTLRPPDHYPSSRRTSLLACGLLSVYTLFLACGAPTPSAPGADASGASLPHRGTSGVRLIDATTEVGLEFDHVNGATGRHLMAEIMGSGVALFDADQDGDLDLYLVQGNRGALAPQGPSPGPEPTDRLYRNELIPTGQVAFVDITAESGVQEQSYGMGVATGDIDNDGDVDLLVTNFGAPDRLLRNRLDETAGNQTIRFDDITATTSVGDRRWTVSGTFADLDSDGWLDLAVTAYVDLDPRKSETCYHPSSAIDYCGPQSYRPLSDRLYRNQTAHSGTISFVDRTHEAGISTPGPGLGIVARDLDEDGQIDLFVANDAAENRYWRNLKGLRFFDDALLSGLATNGAGRREASMGIATADSDGDGDLDLFVTHLDLETNTYYTNTEGLFQDRTRPSGLGPSSLPYTGFGTGYLDANGDSIPDLLVVNGAVKRFREAGTGPSAEDPLAQPALLYLGRQGGQFELAAGLAVLEEPAVGRGAAFGDVDNDGDIDVVILNNGGRARFLRNDSSPPSWIGLRLVEDNRDAIGAKVTVTEPDGTVHHRWVHTDGSYASASDPRLTIALKSRLGELAVEVQWTDRGVESFAAIERGRYQTLRRGDGSGVTAPFHD